MRPLVFFTFLLSCAVAEATQPAVTPKQLDAWGRALAMKPCEFPSKRQERSERNLHDPLVKDTVVTVHCPGVVAEIYQANSTNPPVVLPFSVGLSSPKSLIPKSLQVGGLISEVVKQLGPPLVRKKGELIYTLSEERPDQDTVTFTHGSGRIIKVTWVWEVD